MNLGPGGVARRRILVIHNPVAGWRRRRLLLRVLDRLRAAGVIVTLQATGARGDAERFAAAATADLYDAVASAGGDGTLNEVANGLMRQAAAPPPLGLIPLGTANVMARELGLAVRPGPVAAALLDGPALPLHLGRLRQADTVRHFILMAGIGFDAEVVAAVTPPLKRRLGKGAYVLRSLQGLLAYRPVTYRLEIDGVTLPAASAILMRGRHYAGAYVAAPDARLDDTTLHACLFETPGRLAVMRYGLALLLNRLPRVGDYRIVPARRVVVAGTATAPVQADGDIVAHLPLTVDVAERPLALLVPPA